MITLEYIRGHCKSCQSVRLEVQRPYRPWVGILSQNNKSAWTECFREARRWFRWGDQSDGCKHGRIRGTSYSESFDRSSWSSLGNLNPCQVEKWTRQRFASRPIEIAEDGTREPKERSVSGKVTKARDIDDFAMNNPHWLSHCYQP